MQAQIEQLQQQLNIAKEQQQPENVESDVVSEINDAPPNQLFEIREFFANAAAFVQDVVLGLFPYEYNTVNAVGPVFFWLVIIPLTIIGAGFMFKIGEFSSFIASVNTVRYPCNSTNVLAAMEEYGIREKHCGKDAIEDEISQHVTWWDFPESEFCLFGGKQVIDLRHYMSLPENVASPEIDFMFEQTEDGLLGIRKNPQKSSKVLETNSFLELLWTIVIHGEPARLTSCGLGYVFWDTNHVLYGMGLLVTYLIAMGIYRWIYTKILPMLGLAPLNQPIGQLPSSRTMSLWLLIYVVVFGYVGKALVIREYWANDCSRFKENRSQILGLRDLFDFILPSSYIHGPSGTLKEELGLLEVQLESCDWAHLLAYSRFQPGSDSFFSLFSSSHVYYALVGYTKYIVYKFIILKVWNIIIVRWIPLVVARWKRVVAMRARNRINFNQ